MIDGFGGNLITEIDMSIWMEIRCENRTNAGEGFWDEQHRHQQCWSNENSGPMMNAVETQRDVIAVMREMEKHAIAGGWVKRKSGWYCPHCINHEMTPNV